MSICIACSDTIDLTIDWSQVREYISNLLKNIRTEVLIKLIEPYTRVRNNCASPVHFVFPAFRDKLA